MIEPINLYETGLWEAWIEYDQYHPNYFGTLYIHGEVHGAKTCACHFKKIETAEGHCLKLQLPSTPETHRRTNEVFYSEPIRNLNQYSSIQVFAGNELIACFDEIEVMI